MREIGGILKDDWWVGFVEWIEGEKNEIINRQRTIIIIEARKGTSEMAFLIKLMVARPRK